MCARPNCNTNIKDSRPWCPVCEEHINSTDDPDHQHHR